MSAHAKHARALARQLFKLSLADGAVSGDRVAGVLAYVERHPPANPILVLRDYHRFIATELARSEAIVEHAGPVEPSALAAIAAALSRTYGRPVTPVARPNPSLLAGLRVHVGDDIYESSVAGQLAALAAAV
jgi:F-type H+-transporting ATPase subunit delta